MNPFIVIKDKSIRTDWIHKIQQTKEGGVRTCMIWFSVGPVGHYEFEGKDAETALKLLQDHPALSS